MNILLVGSGNMAIEYAKVLVDLKLNFKVIGRSDESAKKFEAAIGKKVITGGLETALLEKEYKFTHAIVATTLESLQKNTLFLLENGVQDILVEKPGAVTYEELKQIKEIALLKSANVYIAYNRRFYSSVVEAKKRIKEDGGVTSFLFEFTEWSHQIEKLNKTQYQLENWFIGNSTHVLDTAFYLGGEPDEILGFRRSNIEWHPKGSIFVGAGLTTKGVPFSYHANWQAPGSWKLELLTNKNRYIFRPFEQLHVQQLGTVSVNKIECDEKLDVLFKPGLYKQVSAFIFKNNTSELLNIENALKRFTIYKKIISLTECN